MVRGVQRRLDPGRLKPIPRVLKPIDMPAKASDFASSYGLKEEQRVNPDRTDSTEDPSPKAEAERKMPLSL